MSTKEFSIEKFVKQHPSCKEHTNVRGNTVISGFLLDGDRYAFDAALLKQGWTQYDTEQDAWYFGVWVHLEEMMIFTYCEGDLILVKCPTKENLKAELDDAERLYGNPPPAFTAIDIDSGAVTKFYQKRPTV